MSSGAPKAGVENTLPASRQTGDVREPQADSSPHAITVCPNCSSEMREQRCKLSCPRCGFYLSCSDFY
jgi:hypothetical protein